MNRRAALGLCVMAVLLAGCASLSAPAALGEQRHPFAGETVTVTVEGTDRERALTAEALAYWNENASRYAGFPVEFRVVDAESPDVVVRFVDAVQNCADSGYSAGCAPIITNSTAFDRPATVRVQRGFDDASTRFIVRHEAGHVIGLDHDDSPQSIMRHASRLTTPPQPDADERTVPWETTTLTVAVDNETVPADQRGAYRREVAYALAYLNEGADGTVPDNVTLRFVDDPDSADVVVGHVDATDCTEAGSCRLLEGTDPDGDGAIETYTHADIELAHVDTEAVSWHVAHQLLGALGIEPVPERVADAGYDERRAGWHG